MGLWPTRANENQRRPRGSGGSIASTMHSRFRGNDRKGAIFRRVAGDEESRTALKTNQSEIPSLRSGQALRRAQDDSEGLGVTSKQLFPQRPVANTQTTT
jgi:hypothetical protein